MGNGHYILDKNGEPKLAYQPSGTFDKKEMARLLKWAQQFGLTSKDRIVKQDHFGKVMVSTVFLGLDHNWGKGPPILWETMVFGGKLDQHQQRCAGGREQAEAMHEEVVELVKASRKKKRPATKRSR